jgi:hypothetical protein
MAAPMIRCARQVALRKIVVNRNVRQRRRSDGGDWFAKGSALDFLAASAIPQDETRGREGLLGLFQF